MVGTPSTELFFAAVSVVGAFVAAVFAAPWVMRKVNRNLIKAQTIKTEAEADEILDRQAGIWITRYEQRFAELDEFMDLLDEYLLIHAAWDFKVMAALTRAGIEFVEPPPLRPPKRARVRRNQDGSIDRNSVD